jgi:Mrp family chromosome partitioning ATPase
MSIVESALSKVKVEAGGVASPVQSDGRAPVPSATVAVRLPALPELTLTHSRLQELGLEARPADERTMMAQYRAIKRRLLASIAPRQGGTPLARGNVIMVASAQPGEGKSFTSFNLAQSLATERDWTTVLVDADVGRKHLTTSLGLEGQPGLLDMLAKQNGSLLDVAYRTSTDGLLFVPAGFSAENATELMASSRMAAAIDDFVRANPRSLVVFDSSPILATPESRALADAVGQIVYVICAERTLRSDVEAALQLIGEGRQVGVVLNQFRGDLPVSDYYNYGESAKPEPA